MSNWINKHFRKSKCVKVIYFAEGKKQEIYYVIPKGSNVNIKSRSVSLILNDKEFFIDNKDFITYVFSYKRVEPIDPTDADKLGDLSPADLDVAIDSQVASEILSATRNKTDINVVLFILAGVIVLGFLALWYTTNQRFDDLVESLKPIIEALN